MMRALAGVSAAAVALIALPTTVGVAAESETAVAVVAADQTTTGLAGFLDEPSVLGLNMGAFLWLSVALVAAAVSVVAVGRSRAHGIVATGPSTAFATSVTQRTAALSIVPDPAPAFPHVGTAAPVTSVASPFADSSRPGR